MPGLKEVEFNAGGSGIFAFGEADIADFPAEQLAIMAGHHQEVAIEELVTAGMPSPLHKARILDFVCAVDDGSLVSLTQSAKPLPTLPLRWRR